MEWWVCRQLAIDYEENMIPDASRGRFADEQEEDDDDDDDDLNEDDLIETKSVIVKADTAGSLTSIQDTVDQMTGISVRQLLKAVGGVVLRRPL